MSQDHQRTPLFFTTLRFTNHISWIFYSNKTKCKLLSVFLFSHIYLSMYSAIHVTHFDVLEFPIYTKKNCMFLNVLKTWAFQKHLTIFLAVKKRLFLFAYIGISVEFYIFIKVLGGAPSTFIKSLKLVLPNAIDQTLNL